MEKETFTKKYNFRLPDRTIELLDELVKDGVARNRTEALIWAVDSTRNLVSKDDVAKAMEEARCTAEEAKKQQMEQRHRIEELEEQMKDLSLLVKLWADLKEENSKRQTTNQRFAETEKRDDKDT